MTKYLIRFPVVLMLAFMLGACGGGKSAVTNAIADASEDYPRWYIADFTFIAKSSSKTSLLNHEVLTSTSLGLNSDGQVISSVVTISYVDNGPGTYTLVSSLDQLLTRQAENPAANLLLITALIINAADDNVTYDSEDGGEAEVTVDVEGNLVFNISSNVGLIRNHGDAFPTLPLRVLFRLIDIFEDLPTPSLP